jgi:regulatory protein
MSLSITVTPKESIKERFEIHVEGNWWRDIHQTIFGRNPLPPKVSTLEEWGDAFNVWEYRSAKRYVIWRLSKQSYHSENLSKMLRERLVQGQTIKAIIDELISQGFIDDEAWVASFVRSQSKRCGLRVIQQKLRAKGISTDTSSFVDDSAAAENDAILHLLNTRYRKKDLSQPKEKQKVIASLMRKGFQYQQIVAALQDRHCKHTH